MSPRHRRLALLALVGAAAAARPALEAACADAAADGGALALTQRATRARARQQTVRPLSFVHIAKCAGTSFGETLEKVASQLRGAGQRVTIMRNPLRNQSYGSLHVLEREPKCPAPGSVAFFLEEVCGAPLDTMRSCGLPEMAFLRDPIERVVSHYQFYANEPNRTIIRPSASPEDLARRMSESLCELGVETVCDRADSLLRVEKCHLWRRDCGVWINHQVHVLAGSRPWGESMEQRYEVALAHFDEMPFFGLTEYYRHSVCLFLDLWLPGERSMFESCCSGPEPGGDCELVGQYNAQGAVIEEGTKRVEAERAEPDYVGAFLGVRETARSLLDGNRYDCLLYTRALRAFAARAQELEARRGLSLGPVRTPAEGKDFCDEKMSAWLL